MTHPKLFSETQIELLENEAIMALTSFDQNQACVATLDGNQQFVAIDVFAETGAYSVIDCAAKYAHRHGYTVELLSSHTQAVQICSSYISNVETVHARMLKGLFNEHSENPTNTILFVSDVECLSGDALFRLMHDAQKHQYARVVLMGYFAMVSLGNLKPFEHIRRQKMPVIRMREIIRSGDLTQ